MSYISEEIALDFSDVRIVPQHSHLSSRSEVNLIATYTTFHSKQTITGIPIMSANMSSVSTFDMARAFSEHDMFCALHKHYTIEEYDNFFGNASKKVIDHTFYTVGMNDYDKLISLSFIPKLICLDVANGYMESFRAFVYKVRAYAPNSVIMAGNVVCDDGVHMLHRVGADIVKVGIGSGSACHTRIVAGVGIPQLTALRNAIDATHHTGALVCSDGGIVNVGDFSVAFVAGAHFVMAGGMFAGHDECNMEKIIDSYGREMVQYYGMSSEHAMNKHHGGMSNYRASEGKVVTIPYKGSVHVTIEKILGGLRSAGTYINRKNIQDFSVDTKLVRVNSTHNKIYGE